MFVPMYDMNVRGAGGCVALRVLNILQWIKVSGQLHAAAPLPPWQAQLVPMSNCLSGPERRSRRCGEGKIPTGNRTIIAGLCILLAINQQNDYAVSVTMTISNTFKNPVVSTECTRRER